MALREKEEAHLFQVKPANGKMGLDHFMGAPHDGSLSSEGPWGDRGVVRGICESVHGPASHPILFIGYKMNPADTIIYEVFR